VFDQLVECQPRGTRTDALRGGAASVALHVALVGGAVIATMQTTARQIEPHRQVGIVYLEPPDRAVPPPPPVPGTVFAGPTVGLSALTISSIVPTVIPPPSTAPFDPRSFIGVPLAPGPGIGATGPDTAGHRWSTVYAEQWVDERPELLSHPAVPYPEILRQAGIGGRVMVEAVIDTAGRAERGSIKVLSADQPLLGPPAIQLVAASIYQPGRMSGRPVRVRVQIPVDFQVTARGLRMTPTP
jgi:TonB family protein